MLAYKNNKFMELEECTISVYDLGVLMGAGVTDLARTFNGRPWMLREHIDRLFASAKYACIDHTYTKPEVENICDKLVKANYTDMDLAIVFFMTAGENPVYAGAAGLKSDPEPTFIIHTFPLRTKLLWHKYFTEGIHVCTPYVRHIPPNMFDQRIKHRNRLHMWIGSHNLAVPGAVPLFLDENGYVAETSGANIAVYRDNCITAPRANRLNGLGMRLLIDAAERKNTPVFYSDLTMFDVMNADEVWLTTTPYSLGPVCFVNGRDIGNGQPGPKWRELLEEISNIVGKDIYREMVEEKAKKPAGELIE